MISVVTPTYNRAYILGQLYDSLIKQTDFNFEWLIIDDGSSDDTELLVREWIEKCEYFSIQYIKKENGGKHRALNYGIPKAKGEFIFIVDSDDYIKNDAIECINKWVATIEDKPKIAGVAGLRGYPNGKRIGDYPNKKDYVDVKNSKRYTYHLDGDKAEIYRKELLVKYPFPEFEGEKFIGEGSVWNKLSQEGYKVRWYNKIIYCGQYLDDGLTANYTKLNLNNFNGYTYNTKLNYRVLAFPYNLMAAACYIGIAKQKSLAAKQIRQNLDMGYIGYILCVLICKLRRMS